MYTWTGNVEAGGRRRSACNKARKAAWGSCSFIDKRAGDAIDRQPCTAVCLGPPPGEILVSTLGHPASETYVAERLFWESDE